MTEIKVPKALIAHYLGSYTDSLFTSESSDPYDPIYAEKCFQTIKQELVKFNEQTILSAGLIYLMDKVETDDYLDYSHQEESLSDEDMEHVVLSLLKQTKPSTYDDSNAVEITQETIDDFRKNRGFFYKTEGGDTLSRISEKLGIDLETIIKLNPFLTRKYSADGALPTNIYIPITSQTFDWIA